MAEVEERQDRVFTVGHSNHTAEYFISLLAKHGVTALADVRSAPHSRFSPQFGKERIRRSLKDAGIKYVFLGRELGARTNDPTCYQDGQVRYDRLARTELFRDGIERVVVGCASESVALMCTERDPLDCHRTLLVARSLVERGFHVDHILADATLETYEDSMIRLLDKVGQPPPDFFTSASERIEEALQKQEARIAYVDKTLAASSESAIP